MTPAPVRSREFKLAKFILTPFGMTSDTVGDITIDESIALVQPHPETELYLCPFRSIPHPHLSTAWFYSDCIAYDHDIPVIVSPSPADIRKFGFRYIYSGTRERQEIHYHNLDTGESSTHYRRSLPPEKRAQLHFGDQLYTILSEIRDFHHGPLTFIFFRHDGWNGRKDIPYTRNYAATSQEIHLYAAALRQADTLTEYLFYYRVIESMTGSNGKTWLRGAIQRIRSHQFDEIRIGMLDEQGTSNLMALYRRRALLRLNSLLKAHQTPAGLASYLYNVNRCGIAHGRRIIRADITPSYFEMVRDTYLMKLLARMAIDEKLGPARFISRPA